MEKLNDKEKEFLEEIAFVSKEYFLETLYQEEAITCIKKLGGDSILKLQMNIKNKQSENFDNVKKFIASFGYLIFDNIIQPTNKYYFMNNREAFIKYILSSIRVNAPESFETTKEKILAEYNLRISGHAKPKTKAKYYKIMEFVC